MPDDLNTNQRLAVEYAGGPLIIVAGAGTGKTTVITRKIARIIADKMAEPEEILAMTFTEKAADEMTDRVDGLIDRGYADLQISTFHAFCQRLLENYGLDIGLNRNFRILTETDAWMMVRKNLEKFNLDYYSPLGNPAGHIHELVGHFSKCKDELIAPEDYLMHAESAILDKDRAGAADGGRLSELANAYHTYNRLLLDNGCLDFGDLIFFSVRLLQARPHILEALRRRYKYILIDEFQDVNWAQYQLVRLLAGSGSQLTVVGDDDQSIYAFRGASVSNILRFKDDYPGAKEIVLNENYRSGQEILDSAYRLIQNNNPDRLEYKLKLDKRLISRSGKTDAGQITLLSCPTMDEEAESVVSEIKTLKEADPEAVWDDFAILVRANSHSAPFIAALDKAGIPYEFLAASGLYRQPIVLDCVNFLKLLDNYHESSAVYRILCLPCLPMPDQDLQKILFESKKKCQSYFETLRTAHSSGISPAGVETAEKILRLVTEGVSSSRSEKTSAVLYRFLENSGYLKYISVRVEGGDPQAIRQVYHLKQFFDYLGEYEKANPGERANDFLRHFNFVLESGDQGSMYQADDTPDSVNILTVHKAKGLEYKYVFVVNLVEDRFPARKRGEGIEIPADLVKEQLPEGESHWQEERRLFYVAMTRAKKHLCLTGARDYGGARAKKASRFLNEIGLALNEEKNFKAASVLEIRPPEERANPGVVYHLPQAFSFSQIKSYNSCPYQYKLAHILNIPARGNASMSFGTTMHATLQKFYARMQELNKAEQPSLFAAAAKAPPVQVRAPEFEELVRFYEDSWVNEWFDNPAQREKYRKIGTQILKVFYDSEKDGWTVPLGLESPFKIKVGDFFIRGRIDRIDRLPDGTLEIYDYKTGAAKESVQGDDKDQLIIYQMAAEQLPEYKSAGRPSKLTYFFLNDNLKLSFLGTREDVENLKMKLSDAVSQIRAGNFNASPNSYRCKICPYNAICQYKL